MSFILLGILNSQAAGGGAPYWISTIGGTGNDDFRGFVTDSDANIYATGIHPAASGSNEALIVKYDKDGITQWQRTLGGSGTDAGDGIAIDSSNNLYVVGRTNSQGAGFDDIFLAKYNSSGVIQWQNLLGGSSTEFGYGVAIDSTGNVYVSGGTGSQGQGSYDFLLAKYNSSGVIQWQRILGGSVIDISRALAIDSNDNVYSLGIAQSFTANSYYLFLVKYNTSGTVQWQRVLGGAESDTGYGVAIDSSGNVYVSGGTNSHTASTYDFLLAKYTSAGSVVWQRVLGGTDMERDARVALDSTGNVYITGRANSTGAGLYDTAIAKYDLNGTIQWQRTLGGSLDEEGLAIALDFEDNLIVGTQTKSAGAGGRDALIAKLPNDGSLTGTYVLNGSNIVYAVSSLTAAGATLTSSASSLTAATSTLTSTTATLTDASASLTTYLVSL
jgi:uncharacterized delta-60 repeat protein